MTSLPSPTSNNDVGPDSVVKLNIGGYHYETTRNTLLSIPNTFFVGLLSGRFPAVKDKNDAYFIDRDGQYFPPILTFLRTTRIPHLTNMSPEDLLAEAEFYSIKPLITLLHERGHRQRGSVNLSLEGRPHLSFKTSEELYEKIDAAWKWPELEGYEELVVNSLHMIGQKYGVLQATIFIEEVPQGSLGLLQPNAVSVLRGHGIIRIFTDKVNSILCERLAKRLHKYGFRITCEGPKNNSTTFHIYLDWTTMKWVTSDV